jgi:hypothetical protein
VNTPTTYQLDQGIDARPEDHDEQRREQGQDEHAVGEDEPVAAVLELSGQEPVPGEDRRQPREVLKDVFAAKMRMPKVKACTT